MVDAAEMALRAGILATTNKAAVLDRAAALVAKRRQELAATMRREAGFTATDAGSEVDDCIQTLRAAAQSVRPGFAKAAAHCGWHDQAPAALSPGLLVLQIGRAHV